MLIYDSLSTKLTRRSRQEFYRQRVIQVNNDLIAISEAPLSAIRYANVIGGHSAEVVEELGSTSQQRHLFGLTCFNAEVVFITGGILEDFNVTNTVQALDLNDGTFREITAMNTPRRFHSSACLGNELFVFGGLNVDYLSSIERLDIANEATSSWHIIYRHGKDVVPRENAAMCAVSPTKILICGGWGSWGALSDVIIFDIETNNSQIVPTGLPSRLYCVN